VLDAVTEKALPFALARAKLPRCTKDGGLNIADSK